MKYTVGKPKIKSAFAITILLCMIGVWLIVESVLRKFKNCRMYHHCYIFCYCIAGIKLS